MSSFKIIKITADLWQVAERAFPHPTLGYVRRIRDGVDYRYEYRRLRYAEAPVLNDVREALSEDPTRGQRDWKLVEID